MRLVRLFRENKLNYMVIILATCHNYVIQQNVDILLNRFINTSDLYKK